MSIKLRDSPLAVASVALLGYLLIFAVFLNHYKDLRGFVQIGTNYYSKSQASNVIRLDPTYTGYPDNGWGYDGQFAYFMALDPVNARYYVDNAPYRYTRILYPMAARILALGQPDWIPLTLVLVNLLAILTGTWAVAAWCKARGLSPWLALVYAFFVGQVIVFTRDLNEALAYALVALAVYLFDRGPNHHLWSGLVFGLAGLARETTLVFPALYALWLLMDDGRRTMDDSMSRPSSVVRRLPSAVPFASLSIFPAAAWQLVLLAWQGRAGWGQGVSLFHIPFSGVYRLYPLPPDKLEVVQVVVIPGVVCLIAALLAMWKSKQARWRVELWALVLNALFFVVMLPSPSLLELMASARVILGVVLGAIYVLPYVQSRVWFYFCAGIWLSATAIYLLNPMLELLSGTSYK